MNDAHITSPITCIISDVDGVMTDGRIIYDGAGVETKQFHVRDGLGIKLWMKAGFQFGILTSRDSSIVARRAAELGITSVQQGHAEKSAAATTMFAEFGCEAANVCYIGDDLPDIPVMSQVGLSAAPSDAANDTATVADWNLASAGGQGVVRELIERILRAQQRWENLVRS